MKHHLFIAVGILLFLIFLQQGLDAVAAPGLGLRELYVFGGFVFAGLLIRLGLRIRKSRAAELRIKEKKI